VEAHRQKKLLAQVRACPELGEGMLSASRTVSITRRRRMDQKLRLIGSRSRAPMNGQVNVQQGTQQITAYAGSLP
jgi:hypothetical protein